MTSSATPSGLVPVLKTEIRRRFTGECFQKELLRPEGESGLQVEVAAPTRGEGKGAGQEAGGPDLHRGEGGQDQNQSLVEEEPGQDRGIEKGQQDPGRDQGPGTGEGQEKGQRGRGPGTEEGAHYNS